MAKKKQTKPTDTTEYRIYMEHSQEGELVDKLLDLFVHAFIKTELDEIISWRDNTTPQSEQSEEDLEQWLKNN